MVNNEDLQVFYCKHFFSITPLNRGTAQNPIMDDKINRSAACNPITVINKLTSGIFEIRKGYNFENSIIFFLSLPQTTIMYRLDKITL